jgi:hypothetical protein
MRWNMLWGDASCSHHAAWCCSCRGVKGRFWDVLCINFLAPVYAVSTLHLHTWMQKTVTAFNGRAVAPFRVRVRVSREP